MNEFTPMHIHFSYIQHVHLILLSKCNVNVTILLRKYM